MKKYIKIIDDREVIKKRSEITISKNGMTTYNPTEKMLLDNGWVEYTQPFYEPTLIDVRREVKKHIEQYDSSSMINEFYINGTPLWFDKSTRAGLLLRFQSEIALGKTNTYVWFKGKQFILPPNDAIQMLYAVEVYASSCYDITQAHLNTIDSLESIEEVKAYNYKAGYPEKLRFNDIEKGSN